MSQHDYTIANQGFPATRADINNALSAIATNNSGTSAPSTQYAGQFWIDTTSSTWTLYIHDGADDIQFATIDTSANTVNFVDSALDVVTDTTPQLGGNLDLNSNDITGTGNINITGTGTFSGDLTVDTNTLKVDSANNRVGIGTTSPSNKLTIEATTDASLRIDNTGDNTAELVLDSNRSSANVFLSYIRTYWNGTEVARVSGMSGTDTTNKDDGYLRFDVRSSGSSLSEAMRINSDGNVSIGTTSDQAKMHIVKTDVGALNDANANVLMIEHTNAGLTIGSSTTGEGAIHFSDSDDADVGKIQYAHSSNLMTFRTNGANRMFITSDGDVFIGDSNPDYSRRLTVSGNGSADVAMFMYDGGAGTYFEITTNAANGVVNLKADARSGAYPPLTFTTGTNERMRITSTGNVGIGTTSADELLTVALSGSTGTYFEGGGTADSSDARRLRFTSSTTTNAGDTHTINAESSTGNLAFATNNTERMRIDSSGNVGIATSSPTEKLHVTGNIRTNNISNRTSLQGIEPTPNDANNFELGAGFLNLYRDDTVTVKQILFGKNGVEVGSISTTGASTAYNTSSDYRLKENIDYNFDATTRLKQLKPARFNFISDADTTVDGFLAHEVSSVVPEAVTGTHNGVKTWKEYEELPEGVSVGDNKLDENGNTIPEYQGIDQSKLVPLLVKTIQELEARITALETNQP